MGFVVKVFETVNFIPHFSILIYLVLYGLSIAFIVSFSNCISQNLSLIPLALLVIKLRLLEFSEVGKAIDFLFVSGLGSVYGSSNKLNSAFGLTMIINSEWSVTIHETRVSY